MMSLGYEMLIPVAAKLECLAVIVLLFFSFLLLYSLCLYLNKHLILLLSLSFCNLLPLYSATSFIENGSPLF